MREPSRLTILSREAPTSSKHVFSVAAVLTFGLHMAFLLAPVIMLQQWLVGSDPATVYRSRRCGGLFLGYSTMLWLARAAEASPARHAMTTGDFVVAALMAVVSSVGVLGRSIGATAWSAVAVEVPLAAAFGDLLLTERP